MIHRRER